MKNHINHRLWGQLALIVFSMLVFVTTAWAQGPTGDITGTVTDTSGAVMAGVTVEVVNTATGAKREVTSNEAGIYRSAALPPATYTVTVRQQGFKSQTRPNVLLQVQQIARVDFVMAIGEISESVEIVAAAPLLASDDNTVGQVIENKRIVDLPLNGRNFLQLTALSPGVNINSSPSGGARSFQGGQRAGQSVSVNGQRGQFAHFTLDGIEDTDPNFNTYIILPSIDALLEFKVQSATYPAEYGFAVSQINVMTKSGTNQIHGSLFEFLRNSKLDAKNFFDSPGKNIPPFRRNQFGGTIGGPIMKNKLFFFGNYEGLRQVKATTGLQTVPLVPTRKGNFAGGAPIFDPSSRATGTDGELTAQPFPGNMIPTDRIDTVTTTVLPFWPEPNLPGTAVNFLNNEPRRFNGDQYMVRMDYQQNSSLSWYGRFSYVKDREYAPSTFPEQGTRINTRADQVLVGNTWILSPSVVNDARFGWSRFDNKMIGFNSYENDLNGEVLKIKGLNLSANPAFWGLPNFGIDGYSSFGDRTHIYLTHDNIYEFRDNLSWSRGQHMMKMGFTVKPIAYNQLGNQFALGGFNFDGSSTENPADRQPTGEPMADFVLGLPVQSYTAVMAADAALRSTYWAGYFSDSFKVTPKLTVDFGIRYEYLPPFRDINDQSVNVFGLGTSNPILVRASNRGENREPYEDQMVRFSRAELVRDGRMGAGLVRPDRNNWAPRLGMAYSATPNTVIRAGFGVFYSMIDLGNSVYDMARTLAGLRRDYTDRSFPDLSLSGQPFRTGPEAGIVSLPQPLILANSPDLRNSYVNQWSFNIQHLFTPTLVFDIGYVGSESHRLKKMTGWNNPDPGPGSVDPRRPYQQFGWIQYPDSIGNGNYHSLQMKVEQRFSSGFTILGAYTFAKSIDDTSGVRPGSGDTLFVNNPKCNNGCERGRSAFDARHRWVTSLLYELPFGPGKPFLSSAGRGANLLLAGWQLGSILTLESGLPFTPSTGRHIANVGVGEGRRPDSTGVSPNLPRGQQTPERFFNTDAFEVEPLYTFGNAGRNIVEGPGIIGLDLSVMKRFRVDESKYFEFRGEVFNAPNHPLFSFPSANMRGASYGHVTRTRIDSREIQFALRFAF